ncbi:hypothetical protein SAMN02745866_04345, partial [Alteromonadaceae bacterium Bs31]
MHNHRVNQTAKSYAFGSLRFAPADWLPWRYEA